MVIDFDDIAKYGKQKIKDAEDNDLFIDFDEEREEVYVVLWKKVYIFDRKGYSLLNELWKDDRLLFPNKDGYLCVKDEWNELIPVHDYLKKQEREELAKKLNCPIKEVHVNHINGLGDNRLDKLEVLHKDEHARRHNFASWERMQEFIKKHGGYKMKTGAGNNMLL